MADYLQTLQALAALSQNGQLPQIPAPAPSAPIPGQMPPGPPPDVPPMAPAPALNTGLVNQYQQFAGPPPTAPTAPSGLQRVANALLGFGAGVQGQGPQFLQQLQQPQREYQQQLQNYNQQRAQLGVTGLEAAQRQQSQDQAETQQRANKQADREFQVWLQKTGVTDQMAIDQMRQAFELQKFRESEQLRLEQEDRKAKVQQERDARQFTSKYRALGATDTIAAELGRYDAGLVNTLSPAASKWQSNKAKLDDAKAERLARIAAGGKQSEGGPFAVLDNGQIVPTSAVNTQYGGALINGKLQKVTGYVGGKLPAQQQAPQQQGAPTTQTLPGGIQLTTPAPQLNRAQSKAKLVKNGYSSTEADRELDRLGIK